MAAYPRPICFVIGLARGCVLNGNGPVQAGAGFLRVLAPAPFDSPSHIPSDSGDGAGERRGRLVSEKNGKRDFWSIRPASSEINWKVRPQTLDPDVEGRHLEEVNPTDVQKHVARFLLTARH